MRIALLLHYKRRGREVRLEVRLDVWKLVAMGLLLLSLFH
jgi:hypothetical protein